MVAGIVCLIAAVFLVVCAVDILTFLLPFSPRTGMSGTWDPVKLAWMGTICVVASLFHGMNAWRLFQPSSLQRVNAERWSPLAILLWWGVSVLGLLVNYPIPYFNHHVDKFFLILGLVLGWGAWLCLHPASLGKALESRAYSWVRVAMINGLIFFVLAESVLRLADPFLARSGLFSASYDTPGGGIPNQVVDATNMRTNSLGFRDRERSLARTSQAMRIVALGDSFTWGSGVNYDETFVSLVERGLQAADSRAEVVNLGLVGYQPEEYLSLLATHGLAYQPDLVLINFYIGNDLMPAQGAQMIVAGQRRRAHVNGNWFHDHLSWDHWYLSHDLEYTWIMGAALVRRARGESDLGFLAPASTIRADTPDSPAAFSGWSPRYLRMIQGMGDQYLKHDTEAFLSRWNETRAILEKIDVLLRGRETPWVLVLLPAEEQVDQGLKRMYLEMLGSAPEQCDFEKPQRLLREWAQGRDVKVIDLTPAFFANVSQRRLFIDNDIHLNRNGHALAASTILRELREDLARSGHRL
jgi:lysophospholipase L1-like esterase